MFVEYMAIEDKKEAEALLDASAKTEPSEKDELYIVKENLGYQAILKMKRFKKKYTLQKWFLLLSEKGVKAKREMTTAYVLELLVTVISAILFALFVAMAVIKTDRVIVFLWLALVAFLVFLYTMWKSFIRPAISLKIVLIRMM